MDYSFFINKTSSILLDNGFYEGPAHNNVFWYIKIMPPVLYAVNITDSKNHLEKNTYISYLNELYKNLKNCRCSNLVCINVLFSNKFTAENENKYFSNYFSNYISNGFSENFKSSDSYGYSEEFSKLDINNNIHNVFWVFNANEERLLFPKGQPTKLNGIELYFNWKKYEKSGTNSIKIYNNKPYITYAIIVINVLVWAYINLKGGDSTVYNFGTSRKGLLSGQFYRLITAVFMHQEISHLFFNCFSLYIFGRETERILSRVNFIVIYLLTGFLASLFSALIGGELSIGASGAIFGVIGALAAVSRMKAYKAQLMDYFTLVLYIAVSILTGFSNQQIDNTAHIAGALSGFIIQYFYFKFKYADGNKVQK